MKDDNENVSTQLDSLTPAEREKLVQALARFIQRRKKEKLQEKEYRKV